MAMLTNRWNPWADLARMQQDFDRLFMPGAAATSSGSGFPAVNIWSNEEQSLMTAEIPGVDPDKLEITVKDNTVTIRGNRQAESLKDGESWLLRERGEGAFARSFRLPFRVDSDKVKADYQKGILQLTLCRSEQDKPHKITVRSEQSE